MQTIEKESPSPKACRCCSPKATFVSLILVGVIVLVASFVVSAVILTKLQDGMINSARINSPNTNAKAYNDWLTNVPERRSSGDAAYRYFSYYLFNITNIDEVVAASMTPGAAKVIPVVNEVGPYTYRKFQDKLDPTFDANEDKVRWQEYGRYIFQPDYSKMGGSQLSDTSDYFYQPSTIYTAIFGNPLSSPFYQRAEWDFRLAVAAAAPFIYTNLLHTLSGNILLNNSITGASAVQVLRASAYNSSLTALGWTKARDSFARIGAGLYPSNPTKWAGSPPLEYWDFLQQGGYPASYAFSNTNQALAMTQKPSMTTNLAKVRGFNCTDMRLTTTGSAACWIYYNVTAINQYLTFLTPNQITGIKAWVQSLAQTHTSWVFDVMGHQASRYASYFSGPSSCQPDPLVSTNFTNCFMFNNANLYVRTTPWSLLWEDKHLLGPLVFAGRTVNRPTKISYFTNHTSEQDARVDSDITQLGTGINHIADLDNLYVIKNYSTISTLSPSSVWCHRSNDPDYAPDGKYFVQSFVAKGYQFNQVTQEGSTKQNPAFPPGKVADMNRYSLDLSVLGSRSFKIDLWVSELSRHFKAVWARDITFKGIDLRRYTIADSEFAIIPFYGQYHQGLANYTCGSGVMSFSCLPRYGKVDTAELALSTMDLATITTPTPEDFIANAPFGTNFFDPSDLLPYIDMEPISGASMAGSLKMQLNVQVDHWLGAPKSVLNSLTSLGLASNFQQTAPRNRPTLIPTLWLNKIGFLSDKQADTFKTTVYGTQTASKVVLVAGTIVGGVMAVIGLALMVRFVRNTKSRAGFATQPSSDDLTATGGTVAI